MAYNTKAIVRDVDQKPAPQHFNVTADGYEVLHGRHGASFTEILDSTGSPLDTSDGKLPIKTAALEAILASIASRLEHIEAVLDRLDMKHYGPTVDERPAANTVPMGAFYMALQTLQVWQSDGANWTLRS